MLLSMSFVALTRMRLLLILIKTYKAIDIVTASIFNTIIIIIMRESQAFT